jgi:hypothetical protein
MAKAKYPTSRHHDINSLQPPVWSRQTDLGEDADEYAGFLYYASLPVARRTVDYAWRTQQADGVDPEHGATTTFYRWANKWLWDERAAAWDYAKVQEKMAKWDQRENDLRENDWQLGATIREKVATAISDLTVADIAANPAIIAKLIQLAHDLQASSLPKRGLDGPQQIKELLSALDPKRAGRIRMALLVESGGGEEPKLLSGGNEDDDSDIEDGEVIDA